MTEEKILIDIPKCNDKLSGILFVPDKSPPFPSVVFYHGRGSSKKRYIERAKSLAEIGILSLIFDFRGCGESDGDFKDQTIQMGLEDALAGYNYLLSLNKCDPKNVGIWGGSYGAYITSLVIGQENSKSLILEAPAICQDEWWDKVIEKLNIPEAEIFNRNSNYIFTKAINNISKFEGALLVIEHEKDEIIPKSYPQAYFNNAVNTSIRDYKIIKGTPHSLEGKHLDESKELISWWFSKTLLS